MLSELSGPGALAGATRAGYREAERRSGTPIRTLPQPATLMPGVGHHDRRLAPASKKRPITPQWEHVLSGPRDATLWLATPYGHIEIPVCYDAADVTELRQLVCEATALGTAFRLSGASVVITFPEPFPNSLRARLCEYRLARTLSRRRAPGRT